MSTSDKPPHGPLHEEHEPEAEAPSEEYATEEQEQQYDEHGQPYSEHGDEQQQATHCGTDPGEHLQPAFGRRPRPCRVGQISPIDVGSDERYQRTPSA